MLYLRFVLISAHDGYNVEAQQVSDVELLDEGVGAISDAAYLAYVYGVLRLGDDVARSCLHLYEHHLVALRRPCDDVEVAVAEPPVALHYLVAFLSKEVGSKLLSPFSRIVMLGHTLVVFRKGTAKNPVNRIECIFIL